MITKNEEIVVPVHNGTLRNGIIIGQEIDKYVGLVFIVKFRSGNISRLTEREIIRIK